MTPLFPLCLLYPNHRFCKEVKNLMRNSFWLLCKLFDSSSYHNSLHTNALAPTWHPLNPMGNSGILRLPWILLAQVCIDWWRWIRPRKGIRIQWALPPPNLPPFQIQSPCPLSRSNLPAPSPFHSAYLCPFLPFSNLWHKLSCISGWSQSIVYGPSCLSLAEGARPHTLHCSIGDMCSSGITHPYYWPINVSENPSHFSIIDSEGYQLHRRDSPMCMCCI